MAILGWLKGWEAGGIKRSRHDFKLGFIGFRGHETKPQPITSALSDYKHIWTRKKLSRQPRALFCMSLKSKAKLEVSVCESAQSSIFFLIATAIHLINPSSFFNPFELSRKEATLPNCCPETRCLQRNTCLMLPKPEAYVFSAEFSVLFLRMPTS